MPPCADSSPPLCTDPAPGAVTSAAPAGRRRPPAFRALATAVTAALTALALVGCSVRLDTPPEPVPSPDAAEVVRADLAAGTEQLVELARAAAGDDEQVAAELEAIAQASQQQLEALGGIWTPPPRPDDTADDEAAAEDPTDTAAAPATATPEEVLQALLAAGSAVREAITDETWDAEEATLLASITLYRDGAAARLAELLGAEAPTVPEAPTDLPEQLGQASTDLCRTLDALGYVHEVRAARSAGDQRATSRERAGDYRDLAERVALLAGYSGTDTDPRQVSYAVGQDLDETIRAWQTELVPAWLALIGPAAAADRGLLLDHARAAAARTEPAPTEAFPGLAS